MRINELKYGGDFEHSKRVFSQCVKIQILLDVQAKFNDLTKYTGTGKTRVNIFSVFTRWSNLM